MQNQCSLIFHAMSDRTRLKILELLKNKEMCVSDIQTHFDISQPSISHHLDILKRAGLVSYEKRGREVYYTFNKETIIECCGMQFKAFDISLTEL